MPDVLRSPSTSSSCATPPGRVVGDRPSLVCRPVASSLELAAHQRIRHEVFVLEQGLFAESDLDTHDANPETVHLIGLVDGTPAGTVRLWPRGDGSWKGDRLAVVREQRRAGLGRPLVRLAVRTATELGGTRMHAKVQTANVRFFQALGWASEGGPSDYLGVPHQHMTIELR